MILLFLFGVKKKKLTKRKNTGFRFEAAPEQLSSEAPGTRSAQTACASSRRKLFLHFFASKLRPEPFVFLSDS
ncbi:hypothetical protein [Phocaeicola barnesiae]|uniref:hypothetical protein n=1 Tax=Phocaeicola barnesiae TaxID=376804 RepID=UPI0025A4CAE5|nr:hypothetical protein [Phocaeicola barnesiae]MDM8308629.1 hypothetical protein [Phocaeicola barnesiae]